MENQEKLYEEKEIVLNPGDIALLYTDGVTEAKRGKELYGKDRIKRIIIENREKPATNLVNFIIDDIFKFTENEPQYDDITIVAIKSK